MAPDIRRFNPDADDEGLADLTGSLRGHGRTVEAAELRKHASREDAWISIRGKVYDVSAFSAVHPGGDIVLTAAGKDATDVFAAFHQNTDSYKLLPGLYVGELVEDAKATGAGVAAIDGTTSVRSPEYLADVVGMRQELQRQRLFDSSKPFYVYKVLFNLSLLVTSVVLLMSSGSTLGGVVASALVLALFWQQCGWLAHDFLHHQVFRNRALGNAAGILIGNIWQGFSVSWWKTKHNHHHAVPNVVDALSGGDPDIHTTPVLLWSEKLIEGEDLASLPRWLMRNQWFLYWPILCMARTSWVIQSLLFQAEPNSVYCSTRRMRYAEAVGLVIHHVGFLALSSYAGSWPLWLLFCILSQGLGGLLIGVVFTVGHNAMEVLNDVDVSATDFVRLQVRTTRDVTPGLFNDWFTGGLGYQVEHHIWPTLPRHSLPAAARILRPFCAKYGIRYTCEGLVEGNVAVCRLLADLGRNL